MSSTSDPIIVLTRAQVRRVDQLATELLGIPGVVLMENAGASASRIILDIIESQCRLRCDQANVGIVCGGGNNGGDGYVIARHLHNAGVGVTIYSAKDPAELKGDARINADIAQRMGLPIHLLGGGGADLAGIGRTGSPLFDTHHILVDALLGTGFNGEVRGHFPGVIERINDARDRGKTIIAIDVPSGLDCDTGQPGGVVVRAHATITFVTAKAGFSSGTAGNYLGRVYIADIGAPPGLVQQVLRESKSDGSS